MIRHTVDTADTEGSHVAELAATGAEVFWGPGTVPHRVHAVSVLPLNDIGAAGRLDFDLTEIDGTVITANIIDPIYLETTHTDEMVVYRWVDSSVIVKPGELLACDVADAGASGDFAVVKLLVEPIYENPLNIARMTASADAAA